MRLRRWILGALLLAGAGAAHAARLKDLDWLSGTWHGKLGESRMDEVWTEPEGPSMVGTFRVYKADRAKFYEFMTIDQAGDTLNLRLRHFSGDLTAHEDKTGTLVFGLVSLGKHRAIFENKATTPPERLTYTRVGKALVIQLDAAREGKIETSKFTFRRR